MIHETKKIDLRNILFFRGLSNSPHWKMLLGNCMQSFIEVAKLESCQKSWVLSHGRGKKKEETKHPYPTSAKIYSLNKWNSIL